MTTPPWALERAITQYRDDHPGYYPDTPAQQAVRMADSRDKSYWSRAIRTFAEYIAKNEDAPIDPDLLLAREVVAQHYADTRLPTTASRVRDGHIDDTAFVRLALRAVKAAREKADG